MVALTFTNSKFKSAPLFQSFSFYAFYVSVCSSSFLLVAQDENCEVIPSSFSFILHIQSVSILSFYSKYTQTPTTFAIFRLLTCACTPWSFAPSLAITSKLISVFLPLRTFSLVSILHSHSKNRSDPIASLLDAFPLFFISSRNKVKVLTMAHKAFQGLNPVQIWLIFTTNWILVSCLNMPGMFQPQGHCTCSLCPYPKYPLHSLPHHL